MAVHSQRKPVIGLALGGGSARGWAHIGIIRELGRLGIEPDIVCGTSIGALVGGLYVSGRLDTLEEWLLRLNRKEIIRYLDIKLLPGGGFVEGKRLMNFFQEWTGEVSIENLPKPFAAVATELATGREIWIRQGLLLEAVRASIALPGIFTPVRRDDCWLVDGSLVNPVPVSVCRALGADLVIAVNLNGGLLERYARKFTPVAEKDEGMNAEASLLEKLSVELKQRANSLVSQLFDSSVKTPGLFEVLSSSLNIMQDLIVRSRMAGDPPELLIAPRLAHIGLLEFDRAKEAIEEGRASVKRMLPALEDLLSAGGPKHS